MKTVSSWYEVLNKKNESEIPRVGALAYFLRNILIIQSVPVLANFALGYFFDEHEWVFSVRPMSEVIRIFNESVFFFVRVVFWGPILETFGQIFILIALCKWIKSEFVACLICANLAALLHLANSIYAFVFITWTFFFLSRSFFVWKRSKYLKFLMPMGLHSVINLLVFCDQIFFTH
jgi:hypothetical protein